LNRRHKLTHTFRARLLVSLLFFSCFYAAGQTLSTSSRITQPFDKRNLVSLKGNVHPLARPEFDQGAVADTLPMKRILLLLQRSPEQEAALQQLLEEQQSKASPNYHAWLTPEQFGKQFGPADADIQSVTQWLVSTGFTEIHVSSGRTVIEFSGNAGQLRNTFHSGIHQYHIAGKDYIANSVDPQIPAALTPVVAGVVSMHNFPRKPLYRNVGVFSRERRKDRYSALFPSLSSALLTQPGPCGLASGPCFPLTPYDFATIYNVLPLWTATSPIDGTGEAIAIVGQSDIYPQDVSNFREDFGLPPPSLNIIYNGTNPGKLATQGDEEESDLDVEWSGAIAKGATIDFVVSASTNSSAGVDLSAEYIIDNNIAPVMSESYGACELELGSAGNRFFDNLWQQAAAEGITVFVSTGDSGSAVCDQNSGIATNGLSVSGISSTPYNVAVGGTDFNDLQNAATYWNSTNNQITQASAKGYIPEEAWNNTCTNSEFFQFTGAANAESDCNNSTSIFWPAFLAPVGGSGGASNCTVSTNQAVSSCSGGYAKPSWQTGVGVPNDGKRDLPDVSLFAGSGLNASYYLVCETDIVGGCAGGGNFIGVGGTSASAPTMAGIMALVDQKMQSRQGNVNYVLYPLAAQPGASCNSTGTVANSCIFYDVTTGTIAMPCASGGPNCVTNVAGDAIGVLSGYGTTAGFDLATGLGSVNAANLVNNWNTVSFQPTVPILSLNPTMQVAHGSPVNVSISVAPKTGTGTPTGQVSLLTSSGKQAGPFTLTNGSVSTTTSILPGGTYTVAAHYAGDGVYGESDSSPGVQVTVNPEPSTITVQAFTLDQKDNSAPYATGPYGGSVVFLGANVAGQSGQGAPTGTVNFLETLNGTTTNFEGDPYPLNNEGSVMAPLPGYYYQFFTPGTYSFSADYAGDAGFNPSASSKISFTITKTQTSTATSINLCPNQPCLLSPGTPVTIFGTVQSNVSCTGICSGSAASLPTGTVAFYSNGTPLGSPAQVDSSIIPPIASLSTNQLPLGKNNITAQYSGDTNYIASTSAASLVGVVMGTELGLSASSQTATLGQNVTFTAQVGTAQGGGPGLTGTVTFTANGTNLGNPVNLSSNGQAQLTTNSLPLGPVQITANYSGDADYAASSDTLTETVIPTPAFTMSANPMVLNVARPGQSGSTTLTFIAQGGFTGSGSLLPSMCSHLPSESSCSFSPSTVSFTSSNTTALVTLTLATTAPSALVPSARRLVPRLLPGSREIVFISLMVLIAMLAKQLRRNWRLVAVFVALAVIAATIGCGGGSTEGGFSNPGTPIGNYTGVTVTVTINGVQQSINNLSVDVQ
jgi:hypothetical protein